MARPSALDPNPIVWTRGDLPARAQESERDIYASPVAGAVYRLRLLPIPYAVACRFGCVYFHGQRYAVPH